jgi:HlyD family secretion protein
MKKGLIIISLLIILALILYVTFKNKKSQLPSTLITAEVKEGVIEETIYETGTIEPLKKVEIKSKIGGEIVKINVEVGEKVKRGAVLALIDSRQISYEKDRELKEAEYNVMEMNSIYFNSRNKLDRNQRLFDKKMIHAQEFDDIKKEHDVALAQLESAMEKWEILKKEYEERLKDYVIVAPIDGIVIERSAEEGEVISAGTVGSKEGSIIMAIADKGRLLVRSKINETNINKVKIGQKVKIIADGAPKKVYNGRVIKIANVGKTENNIVTFEVLAEITDSDNLLKPGMTAKIDITAARKEKVLLVPVDAVFAEEGKNFVYVSGKTEFEKREVKTGISDRINIEIISGLNKGESIKIP